MGDKRRKPIVIDLDAEEENEKYVALELSVLPIELNVYSGQRRNNEQTQESAEELMIATRMLMSKRIAMHFCYGAQEFRV